MNVPERQKARFRFLNGLYEATEGVPDRVVDTASLSEALKFERQEAWLIMQYLMNEGLMKFGGGGGPSGWVSITHRGVLEVEAAHTAPETPTEHFPANVRVSIGRMTGSIVQTGTGSTASISSSFDQDMASQLLQALAEVRQTYEAPSPPMGVSKELGLKAVLDAEDELRRAVPNTGRLASALNNVAFAIQTVPALRPTYQLISTVLKATSGLELPDLPLP